MSSASRRSATNRGVRRFAFARLGSLRTFVRRRLWDFGPVIALALLCLIFSVSNPRFLTAGNLIAIADASAIRLVLAVGMTFVILTGAIDLAIEGIMAACSLAVALMVANDQNANQFGLFGVLFTVLFGATFGLANGLLNTRLRIPSFMVTLGMWSVGIGVGTVLFGGHPPRILDQDFRAWELDRWMDLPPLTYVAVAIVAIGYLVQKYTRLGRYCYAIGGAEDIALLSGINVRLYRTIAFVLSGACAGLGAVMSAAQLGVGEVATGSGQLFATITAVVVGGTLLTGGRGGVLHSVVGVLIISVLANGMILAGVSPYAQRAVQSVIIVTAIVLTTWPLRGRLRVMK